MKNKVFVAARSQIGGSATHGFFAKKSEIPAGWVLVPKPAHKQDVSDLIEKHGDMEAVLETLNAHWRSN